VLKYGMPFTALSLIVAASTRALSAVPMCVRADVRRFALAGVLLVGAIGVVASARAAEDFSATVSEVTSGDTLQVADGERRLEVRLADIGAPHGSDFYAPGAQTLLSALVSDKTVRVVITGRSGPDRVFGRVYAGQLDVNLELVRRGAAWLCLEYADDTDYMPFENDARRYRRGLWSGTTAFDALIRCRQRPPAERPVGKP
jgi:micrococcal nuclease